MIKTPRQNAIDLHDKYPENPIEKGRMIYISSAWLKTCDLYQKFLNFYHSMISGDKHYFVASLDYKVGIDAGLFSQEEIDIEKAVQEAVENIMKEKEKRQEKRKKIQKIITIISTVLFVICFIKQNGYITS